MRLRLLACSMLAGLIISLSSAQSAERPVKRAVQGPTLVVRLASLDRLIEDGRYLASLVGKEEEANQGEKLLKAFVGDKGLEGLDIKRPMALYARATPDLVDSSYALMLPIADQQALLDLLGRLGYQGDKGQNDIYKVENLPNLKVPLYYRFANKYLYATIAQNPDNLSDSRLLPPEAVLQADDNSTASVAINFDQVPEQLRDLVMGQVSRRLGEFKAQKLPKETQAQRKLRDAAVVEYAGALKTLLREGQKLSLKLNIDRKANDLSITAQLTAKPGSSLARTLNDLGKQTSIGTTLIGPDSAGIFLAHLALPEKLGKFLGPVLDEGFQLALKQVPEKEKALVEPLFRSILPTLKMAELDGGWTLRGPGQNEKYTLVAGAKVKKGAGIEQAFRDAVKTVPPDKDVKITLDVDSVAGVKIHKFVSEKPDKDFNSLFGPTVFYVAFRDDALLLALGEDALPALKSVLTATPKAGKVLQIEMAMARWVPVLAREDKRAREAARKAFQGKNAGRLTLVLEGGNGLRLRASMKGEFIRFVALIEEMKKNEQ